MILKAVTERTFTTGKDTQGQGSTMIHIFWDLNVSVTYQILSNEIVFIQKFKGILNVKKQQL